MPNDTIVYLTKRDIPKANEFVCLGHFDCAQIISDETTVSRFYEFKNSDKLRMIETDDPEGLQQNYLIHSGVSYGVVGLTANFLFLMTISINNDSAGNLENNIHNFRKRLEEARVNERFRWDFYYPVARGDVILTLESNTFVSAIKALYRFVYKNKAILSSFTIPMIRKSWLDLPSNSISDCEHDDCYMHLRATVRDYASFYRFIRSLNVKCKQHGFPQYYASFGTDDVQVDFGKFSERKLHTYLNAILKDEGQRTLREVVFSSELSIPHAEKDDNNEQRRFEKKHR